MHVLLPATRLIFVELQPPARILARFGPIFAKPISGSSISIIASFPNHPLPSLLDRGTGETRHCYHSLTSGLEGRNGLTAGVAGHPLAVGGAFGRARRQLRALFAPSGDGAAVPLRPPWPPAP